MIRFFAQALDNHADGSRTYLESLEHVFTQDRGTGMIEVSHKADERVFLLYLEGQLLSAYHQTIAQNTAIQPGQVYDLWQAEEVPIRSTELPSQALRAVRQALEWHPPLRRDNLKGALFGPHLEKLKQGRVDCLLHITAPDADGFMLLVNGSPAMTETIFSTPRGFEDMLPYQRLATSEAGIDLCIDQYLPGTVTPTCQQMFLRVAFSRWMANLIQAYQQLVGANLINALNYDLNTILRLKRWNIRLVGSALVEHHLFMDVTDASEAYRVMIQKMLEHISKVIGDSLARRVASDAHKKLLPREISVLETSRLSTLP